MKTLLLALSVTALFAQDSVFTRAMRDELSRALSLQVTSLEKPYFIGFAINDGANFAGSASLGGLVNARSEPYRAAEIAVRVGDYKFDNTNYVGAGFQFAGRGDAGRIPLDNDYLLLRRHLWLATDSAYKNAVETISRKRAALKNVAAPDALNDFAAIKPLKFTSPARSFDVNEDLWKDRVRRLSAIFAGYQGVKGSAVDVDASRVIRYLVTSEGTETAEPETVAYVRARAAAQAPDGMTVRDSITFHALSPDRLPTEQEMAKGVETVAQNVVALAKAPVGEAYNGPVLFEGIAGPQILAEVIGRNLTMTRRPVMEPGRGGAMPVGELEGRIGARILPDWLDIVDDPTQTEWRGRPLFGSYKTDREGVAPSPLAVVEKGVLKRMFLTRQPVRNMEGSNGRARLPGAFGAQYASMSNFFVKASETVPVAELKKKLLEIVKTRDKPYGILVRKMDFPSSASMEEARRVLSGSGQSGSRPVSSPLLVYRIYPDGREELIRGVRFRNFNARSLKDILAAGDDQNLLEFMDNTAPFALIGGATFSSEASAVAPSILVDDLELQKIDEEQPKLPMVPAPDLVR